MTQDELPTTIEELQKLVLEMHRKVVVSKQQTVDLTATITAQKKQLEKSEQTFAICCRLCGERNANAWTPISCCCSNSANWSS